MNCNSLKLLAAVLLIFYGYDVVSGAVFLWVVFTRKGFAIPLDQVAGLTVIVLKAFTSFGLVTTGVCLLLRRSRPIRWLIRLSWVRIVLVACSIPKLLAQLWSVFQNPDRGIVFGAVAGGLGFTLLLALIEIGYLFHIQRRLVDCRESGSETTLAK